MSYSFFYDHTGGGALKMDLDQGKSLRRLGPEAPDPHLLEFIYFVGPSAGDNVYQYTMNSDRSLSNGLLIKGVPSDFTYSIS